MGISGPSGLYCPWWPGRSQRLQRGAGCRMEVTENGQGLGQRAEQHHEQAGQTDRRRAPGPGRARIGLGGGVTLPRRIPADGRSGQDPICASEAAGRKRSWSVFAGAKDGRTRTGESGSGSAGCGKCRTLERHARQHPIPASNVRAVPTTLYPDQRPPAGRGQRAPTGPALPARHHHPCCLGSRLVQRGEVARKRAGPLRAKRPGLVPSTRLKCRLKCDWS